MLKGAEYHIDETAGYVSAISHAAHLCIVNADKMSKDEILSYLKDIHKMARKASIHAGMCEEKIASALSIAIRNS